MFTFPPVSHGPTHPTCRCQNELQCLQNCSACSPQRLRSGVSMNCPRNCAGLFTLQEGTEDEEGGKPASEVSALALRKPQPAESRALLSFRLACSALYLPQSNPLGRSVCPCPCDPGMVACSALHYLWSLLVHRSVGRGWTHPGPRRRRSVRPGKACSAGGG